MRILFVDQYSSLGGGQQCLMDSVQGVLNRQWLASAALPGEGPLAARLRAMGVDVTPIQCGSYASGRKSVWDVARYIADTEAQKRTLRRLLEERPFDLIYANGPRILGASAAVAEGGIPMLFHLHNNLHHRYALHIVGRSLRNENATIAACCRSVARPLAAVAPQERLNIVPNGVSAMPYDPPPKSRLQIGMIGRVAPEKGHLVFVEAARMMTRLLPKAVFLVCGSPGSADGSYFERVETAAQELPIVFIPWQDRIDRVLGDLSLLVVPSLDEGAPRVILEAFSAGVPVLASRVGGIPELIEDGQTGFLFEPGSPTELASQMERLLGDTDRLRSVAANARSAWERYYDVEIYRNRITCLIEAAVEAARTRGQRGHTESPRPSSLRGSRL